MKKSILATILLTATVIAHAGPLDYACGMKRTQQEVNNCVQMAVNGGQIRMQKNYDRISASSKVTQEQKQHIGRNHQEWAKAVDRKCRDNVCVYNELFSRNAEIEQFMREHGLRPV